MVEDITIKTDNLQKLFLDEVILENEEDELAFFMNKFNLNIENLEAMPALREHIEPLLSRVEEDWSENPKAI